MRRAEKRDMQTLKPRTLVGLVACCLPLAALACDQSDGEAQREADNAQAQSTTQITNAQVEADKKKAEAQHDFKTTRENYRHDVQTKLDDLDQTIADLDAKAKADTGHAKAKLDAGSRTCTRSARPSGATSRRFRTARRRRGTRARRASTRSGTR